jgi:hypothetical protein
MMPNKTKKTQKISLFFVIAESPSRYFILKEHLLESVATEMLNGNEIIYKTVENIKKQ